eukprot:12358543-Prorocentrum_lima.AAC.1
MWSRWRLWNHGALESPLCPWCGAMATTWHRYWECPRFEVTRGTAASDLQRQAELYPGHPVWVTALFPDPR